MRDASSNLCWNQEPCSGKALALEDAVGTGMEAGMGVGKVTVKNYGTLNYRFLVSCV